MCRTKLYANKMSKQIKSSWGPVIIIQDQEVRLAAVINSRSSDFLVTLFFRINS